MTRGAYGKDAIYTRMALDSLHEWQALSAVSGLPIFIPHGVLFFFPTGRALFPRQPSPCTAQLGLPIEALDQARDARRFPMIDFSGVKVGLFEPGFGALMARRAVQTLVDELRRAGGDLSSGRGHAGSAAVGPAHAIALSNGERDRGRRASSSRWGPGCPSSSRTCSARRIFATRQEVFFFAPPAGDRRFQPGAMPGWADFNGGDIYYGFPDLEGRGVKFAHDTHGAESTPTPSRASRPEPRWTRSSPSATAASRCCRAPR